MPNLQMTVLQAGSKLVALATHLQGIAPGPGKTTIDFLFEHPAVAVVKPLAPSFVVCRFFCH